MNIPKIANAFTFRSYARVGADSVASTVAAVDTRATALNSGIDSWITSKGTTATPEDAAFVASWKQWFGNWITFRTEFYGVPDLLKETDTSRTKAESSQKELFVWEARFETAKAAKSGAVNAAATTPMTTTSKVVTVGILSALVYGIYRYYRAARG